MKPHDNDRLKSPRALDTIWTTETWKDEKVGEVRRSISPAGDDTWESIATRELSETPISDAVSQLQSWNLHVFMRPAGRIGSAREGNPILPSDVIFLEPPTA